MFWDWVWSLQFGVRNFGVWDFEFRVLVMRFEFEISGKKKFWSCGIRVWDLCLGILILEFGVWNCGVWNFEFEVLGMGYGIRILEF